MAMTPKPKPTIAGLKKANLDKPKKKVVQGLKDMKQANLDKPKPKVTPKPTVKPSPKNTLGPLPKNPTLNDYLARGLKVPKAPGQKKLPSDSDVILKGYNDKKTVSKYKKK